MISEGQHAVSEDNLADARCDVLLVVFCVRTICEHDQEHYTKSWSLFSGWPRAKIVHPAAFASRMTLAYDDRALEL